MVKLIHQQAMDLVGAMRKQKRIWHDVSPANIAKEINYPVRKVRTLLKYVKEEHIAYFKAAVNFYKLGLHPFFIWVRPSELTHIPELNKGLSKLWGVTNIYNFYVQPSTILFKLWLPPTLIYDFARDEVKGRFGDKIASFTIDPVLTTFFDNNTLVPVETEEKVKIDETDLRLINVLRKNNFYTLREIGSLVGLSAPSVFARIKHLNKKGVINGSSIPLDWKRVKVKAGATRFFCCLQVNNSDLPALTTELLKMHNDDNINVRVLYGTLGQYNLVFSFTTDAVVQAVPAFLSNIVNRYSIKKVFCPIQTYLNWNDFPFMEKNVYRAQILS